MNCSSFTVVLLMALIDSRNHSITVILSVHECYVTPGWLVLQAFCHKWHNSTWLLLVKQMLDEEFRNFLSKILKTFTYVLIVLQLMLLINICVLPPLTSLHFWYSLNTKFCFVINLIVSHIWYNCYSLHPYFCCLISGCFMRSPNLQTLPLHKISYVSITGFLFFQRRTKLICYSHFQN